MIELAGPLVIIPTYQEAPNIATVLTRVRRAAPEVHVLVVDDGSPDGTADLAEHLALELGGVDVLRRSGKAGLGSAYKAGFAWGLERGATVLVEMDADLSHDPAALPSLLGPATSGVVDLVIGSRYVPGGGIPDWAWHRRKLSLWGNRYAGLLLGLPVRDATAGYRAYRAETLAEIDLSSVRADGYGFQIEMAHRVHRIGGRILEVPISFAERTHGTSKMSGAIVGEALLLVTWWGIRDRWRRWTGGTAS